MHKKVAVFMFDMIETHFYHLGYFQVKWYNVIEKKMKKLPIYCSINVLISCNYQIIDLFNMCGVLICN